MRFTVSPARPAATYWISSPPWSSVRFARRRSGCSSGFRSARRTGELVREKEGRNPPLPFVLTGVDPSHPYLVERGIDRATAVAFGVGFYARSGLLTGRIVIPIANARGQ